jgi:hypothetical protein
VATDKSTLIAERMTGLGGSDIHHLFGLEPNGCLRSLNYEKQAWPQISRSTVTRSQSAVKRWRRPWQLNTRQLTDAC